MAIFGDLLGSTSAKASNSAASDTYYKLLKAADNMNAYGDQYRADYSNLAKQYQPYQDAGQNSLAMILNGLGLNGAEGSQAFTDAYRASPGYQAGLDTGGRVVAANANAGNMLESGKTLKALQRFGSNYEDQRSQQYLQNLFGLEGQGYNATNASVATQGQGLQGQMQARQSAFGAETAAAPVIGEGQVAGAQAKQNALTNIMNTAAYLGGSYMGRKR